METRRAGSLTRRTKGEVALTARAFAAAQRTVGTRPPPPSSLGDGRFSLERELGRGGEGTVYAAFDRERRQHVALKMLHLGQATALGALKREFRFLRGLVHPNLVQLHELFVDEQSAFFTMELVDGIPFTEAAGIEHPLRALAAQLCEAVLFLHEAGILHRDLKPSNILVRKDGRVVVLDFGAGLEVDPEARPSDEVVGTPIYIAPEHDAGEAVTPASDAFSFGVLLFECLTTERPPPGTFGAAARPSQWAPEVPADLDQLVVELMDRLPDRRPPLDQVLTRLGAERRQYAFASEGTGMSSLIGRGAEYIMLESAWKRASLGQEFALAFVCGAAGSGKTYLLDRLIQERTDALVLRSTCYANEFVRHKAFDGIVAAWIAMAEASRELRGAVRNNLSAPEAGALARLFPELLTASALGDLVPEAAPEPEPDAVRRLAYRGLGKLLEMLGRDRSLLIIVDSLEAGDVDSAHLLHDIFVNWGPVGCLLILSYRNDAIPAPCVRELRQGTECLEDRWPYVEVTLYPLSPGECRMIVEHELGREVPEAICNELHRVSDGNPGTLLQLLHFLEPDDLNLGKPVPSVNELIGRRLARVSAQARELFAYVCLGRSLPIEGLSRLLGADGSVALDELHRERLVRVNQSGLDVEAIQEDAASIALEHCDKESQELHSTLASLLARDARRVAETAHHLRQAGRFTEASSLAALAAEEARSRLAPNQAIAFYQLAIQSLEAANKDVHRSLTLALAESLAEAGRGAEAAPLFTALAETAHKDASVALRRRATEQLLRSGAVRAGWALLTQTYGEAGLSWPSGQNRAIFSMYWYRLLAKLTATRVQADARPTARILERLEACRSAWAVAHVSSVHGGSNSATYYYYAKRSRSAEHLALGAGMEAIFVASAGSSKRAVVERLRETAERYMPDPREGYREGFLRFVRAETRYLMCDLQEAVLDFEAAERVLAEQCSDVAWELAACRIFWASGLTLLSRFREADRRVGGWLHDAQKRKDDYSRVGLLLARGRTLGVQDGDPERARQLIAEATANWTSPFLGVHGSYARIVACQTELIAGRPEAALAQMEALRRGGPIARLVQIVRVSERSGRAICRLKMAIQSPHLSERRRCLKEVAHLAKQLGAEQMAWSLAASLHLEGSKKYLESPGPEALHVLREAIVRYRSAGFELHAASLELTLAQILGGQEGAELKDRGHSAFIQLGADARGAVAEAYAPSLAYARLPAGTK